MALSSRSILIAALSLTQACSLATNFDRFKPAEADGGGGDGGGNSGGVDGGGNGGKDGGNGGSDGGNGGGDAGDASTDGRVDAASTPGLITVEMAGSGTGFVSSSPGGITCGSQCTAAFTVGEAVSFDPVPVVGGFVGFEGACTGLTCEVTATDAPQTVTARFHATTHTVSVVRGGSGAGIVTSEDGVIQCDGTPEEVCSADYGEGAKPVLLAEVLGDAATFAGWGGACSGVDDCALTMDGDRAITAVFDAEGTHALLVTKTGTGEGSVVSDVEGILCGAVCGASFDDTATVMLTATPAANSAGTEPVWSGDCTPQVDATQCEATMDAVRAVAVEFVRNRHQLEVAWQGAGSGSVTASEPEGLDCASPDSCTEEYDEGTTVTLVAAPSAGSSFVGWAGGGCGVEPECQVTVSGPSAVIANFAVLSYALTASVQAGDGDGEILCDGGACGESYAYGTVVELTAEGFPGSEHASWGGSCSAATPGEACELTITRNEVVLASFGLEQFDVDVSVVGMGSVAGDVTCASGTCSSSVGHGTEISLTAASAQDWNFGGWAGDCGGTGACVITVTSDVAVTANFNQSDNQLVVSKTGKGDVTSAPSGISCGAGCSGESAEFAANASVTLTATPATGYAAATFTGCDSVGANTCTVTVSATTEVGVTFAPNDYTLNAGKTGNGAGTLVADLGSINCGVSCAGASDTYPFDTQVVLTATAHTSSNFASWGGLCAGEPTSTCVVTIGTGVNNVSARFEKKVVELVVVESGGNGSSVLVAPAGTGCSAPNDNCHSFEYGDSLTLTAQPDTQAGTVFDGWDLVGNSTTCNGLVCNFNIQGNVTATANYSVASYDLTAEVTGPGSVTAEDTQGAGFTCVENGDSCERSYDHGSFVTLTPEVSVESARFVGWGNGPCETFDDVCTVTLDQAKLVTAQFANVYQVSVLLEGGGVGGLQPLVVSGPGELPTAISCSVSGGTCAVDVDEGSDFVLTATAPAWAHFEGWKSCPGDAEDNRCAVTDLSNDAAIEAIFAADGVLGFTTSGIIEGYMEGRGDAFCGELAAAARLPGGWAAWLSYDRHNAIDSFEAVSEHPVIRLDGALIFPSFRDLDNFQGPMNLTEQGNRITLATPVWTGTDFEGQASDDDPWCLDWGMAPKGGGIIITPPPIAFGIGDPTSESATWTVKKSVFGGGERECSQLARLYCFQTTFDEQEAPDPSDPIRL